jgi:DNA invertase Pin-like site-specific DNA recombinase
MKAINPGDTVVVTKLDRLARSSRDLLNILHDLEEGACGFVSLGETWCDTTSDVGKLVVTIMSGIAEFERKLITARCEEGIAKARANGKKFGRPSALDVGQRRKIAERYAAGETMAELAREYECGEATIWRALQGQGPFEVAA